MFDRDADKGKALADELGDSVAAFEGDVTDEAGMAAIMAEAGLSYLGVGAQHPMPTWGKMLSDMREQILFHPWHILPPGIAILLTVVGFNFLGDGLRDLLDPRLRQIMRANARVA